VARTVGIRGYCAINAEFTRYKIVEE